MIYYIFFLSCAIIGQALAIGMLCKAVMNNNAAIRELQMYVFGTAGRKEDAR